MLSAVARRTAIPAMVATLLLTLAAACSPSSAEKGAPNPSVTVATEPERTTTTNPYAVPTVIDIPYVNRVLAGLDAAVGDVARIVIRTRTIPPEAYDRLKSLYSDADFLQIKIDGYQRDIRDNFKTYKPNPGNKQSTVTQLISTRATCVFARVRRDYSQVGVAPLPELEVQWIALKPLDSARDPNHYNPTPWAFTYDGFPPDHSQPPDPCGN
jgi:hypothetical protein